MEGEFVRVELWCLKAVLRVVASGLIEGELLRLVPSGRGTTIRR